MAKSIVDRYNVETYDLLVITSYITYTKYINFIMTEQNGIIFLAVV